MGDVIPHPALYDGRRYGSVAALHDDALAVRRSASIIRKNAARVPEVAAHVAEGDCGICAPLLTLERAEHLEARVDELEAVLRRALPYLPDPVRSEVDEVLSRG